MSYLDVTNDISGVGETSLGAVNSHVSSIFSFCKQVSLESSSDLWEGTCCCPDPDHSPVHRNRKENDLRAPCRNVRSLRFCSDSHSRSGELQKQTLDGFLQTKMN